MSRRDSVRAVTPERTFASTRVLRAFLPGGGVPPGVADSDDGTADAVSSFEFPGVERSGSDIDDHRGPRAAATRSLLSRPELETLVRQHFSFRTCWF